MKRIAFVLFFLAFGFLGRFVAAEPQSISLTITPSGEVAIGTKLSIDSCWSGFNSGDLNDAFLTGNATIQFSVDGGSWAGLPTIFAGVIGAGCFGSSYIVLSSWAGHTIGLRALYGPTGQTSNVVGLAVSAFSLTLFVIQVTVLDQMGNDYDGVTVELWYGSSVIDRGVTNGGIWSSIPVEGGGRNYQVQIYNGQTVVEPVRVYSSNILLAVQMPRMEPSPNLILSKIDLSPGRILVGSTFNASIIVSNTGSLDALAAELSFNLTYPFAIVASGTTIFIGKLNAGSSTTLSAEISVDRGARTGTYSVPYVFQFSDQNNYTYTDTGTFGVTLFGQPQIEIESISIDPAALTPETVGELTLSITNAGTERATDVRIRILNGDDFLTSTASYVGTVDPDKSATISFGVNVQDSAVEGRRSLEIVMSYSDPTNATYQISRSYDVTIYQQQPFISLTYVLIAVVGILVVVFGYVGFRRLGYKLW